MAAHGRALVLTAHLGNWELLAAAHRLAGYPLSIVVRPLDSASLNMLAGRLRRKSGVELIDKRGALRPVLRALAAGRMVAILLDQNAARHEGVFVPFFGRTASTSKSLAVLAVRTRTPVVPIFIRREGRHHRVTIHPPLDPPAVNDVERAVVELTMRCTAAIEAAISEVPEQWLWAHNRWRTRPAAAGRALRLAREAYEKALWEAGAADFVRASVVDAAGGFRMEDLPAGAWLLIATRSVFTDRASPRIAKRERETYAPALRLRGFNVVSVWVRALTVSAGRTEEVELLDRNVWFTGIEEERALDAGP